MAYDQIVRYTEHRDTSQKGRVRLHSPRLTITKASCSCLVHSTEEEESTHWHRSNGLTILPELPQNLVRLDIQCNKTACTLCKHLEHQDVLALVIAE